MRRGRRSGLSGGGDQTEQLLAICYGRVRMGVAHYSWRSLEYCVRSWCRRLCMTVVNTLA